MRAPARARAPGRACSVCIAGGALTVTARADVIVIVIRDVTVTRIVTPTIIAMCSAKPLASVPPPAAITLAPAPHQQLRSSPHGAACLPPCIFPFLRAARANVRMTVIGRMFEPTRANCGLIDN